MLSRVRWMESWEWPVSPERPAWPEVVLVLNLVRGLAGPRRVDRLGSCAQRCGQLDTHQGSPGPRKGDEADRVGVRQQTALKPFRAPGPWHPLPASVAIPQSL